MSNPSKPKPLDELKQYIGKREITFKWEQGYWVKNENTESAYCSYTIPEMGIISNRETRKEIIDDVIDAIKSLKGVYDGMAGSPANLQEKHFVNLAYEAYMNQQNDFLILLESTMNNQTQGEASDAKC
jgi:hypothetical protein